MERSSLPQVFPRRTQGQSFFERRLRGRGLEQRAAAGSMARNEVGVGCALALTGTDLAPGNALRVLSAADQTVAPWAPTPASSADGSAYAYGVVFAGVPGPYGQPPQRNLRTGWKAGAPAFQRVLEAQPNTV